MAQTKVTINMAAASYITLLSAIVAVAVCASVGQQQVLRGSDGLEFQVISASQFSKQDDLWVYLLKRVKNGKSLDKPANKLHKRKANQDQTYRKEIRKFENELNSLVPKFLTKTNSIVFNSEDKINKQYSAAEKQLDTTIHSATANSKNANIKKLVQETIPKSVKSVNDAVHNAELNINSKIWQSQVLLNQEVSDADAKLDKSLKSKKKIDPKKITSIIDKTQTDVKKQLADDGKILSGYIDVGNQIVADNIALVEGAVKKTLSKEVSDKVNKDIKTASVEIDDSISQGKESVRKEVDEGIKQWLKLVPGWAKKN